MRSLKSNGMTIKVIPESKDHWLRLRSLNINSTEIASLFNLSPYSTAFELYHRHASGLTVEFTENERTKWGTRLQNSIAHGIAEEKKWIIREANEYLCDPDLKMGSSFDFMITDGVADIAILEIKNVDSLAFRDGWIEDDDGSIEAPPHIELQVQHQLGLAGLKRAYIGALVGGNRLVLIEREADPELILSIKQKVKEFWQRVREKNQPDPDFKHDAEVISKLYGYAEPGKSIDSNEEIELLAMQYREASDSIKELETVKDEMKARLLIAMGSAEKITSDKFTVTAGIVGESKIDYVRKGYRTFKINGRKNKDVTT